MGALAIAPAGLRGPRLVTASCQAADTNVSSLALTALSPDPALGPELAIRAVLLGRPVLLCSPLTPHSSGHGLLKKHLRLFTFHTHLLQIPGPQVI
jgi:hypothetical protein